MNIQIVGEDNTRLEIDKDEGLIQFFINTDNKYYGTELWVGSVDELFKIIWKEIDYQYWELTVPDMEQRIENLQASLIHLQKTPQKVQ